MPLCLAGHLIGRSHAAQPDSPTQYAADQAGFGVPKVSALKEGVVQAISPIEHGEHLAARETFAAARRYWTGAAPNLKFLRTPPRTTAGEARVEDDNDAN
jgi:hypothetical protein